MKTHADNPRSIDTTLLTAVAFVLAVSLGSKASAAIVNIPDPGLEAAIRDALSKPAGDITDTDLAGLIFLPAGGRGITDLTGLEYCVNMLGAELYDNSITDLGPLAGLTRLERLYLSENNISDLGPLAGLTSLWRVALHTNNISNLGPLAGLTNLEYLNLWRNSISDIQPLVDNAGLDGGDQVGLRQNPLSCKAITVDIPILQGRGVAVSFDPLAFLHLSIRPRILSVGLTRGWITCTLRTGQGCDVGDIDVASIRLADTLEVQSSHLYRWWGTLVVTFSRSEVVAMVEPGEAELTLTGQFTSGLEFEASDTIRVIDPRTWWWW